MAEGGGPLRLKAWMVAQIESGRYPGLRWEEEEEGQEEEEGEEEGGGRGAGRPGHKTLFRLPWKHAAKQGYRPQQDAALFRAWAIYKGKYREGADKADPSTWKTRLRCALNKSADFQEVPERSQLDISDPYKVYQIVSASPHAPEPARGGRPKTLHPETAQVKRDRELGTKDEKLAGVPQRPSFQPDASFPSPSADHRYQLKDALNSWSAVPSPLQQRSPETSLLSPSEDISNSDCWLHVRLFYRNVLAREWTTRTAEGCRLSSRPEPPADRRLFGPARLDQMAFPPPPRPLAALLRRLLPHLEGGVLLWVAPEGVFAKRQCQGRVYCEGPLAPDRQRPNKLERDRTYKLLDTHSFLEQLRGFLRRGEPPPRYRIRLCFGEEFPAPPGQDPNKLIMAHVEPVFARELVLRAQRLRTTPVDPEVAPQL
ncbi:interferon regulatory factor 4-like [Ornithorhynchus anatinus]|uniref:interferon regulatory factor 4-like n=1 Tax=Ornithorhynchus anatinus TaxID=9258 RepID=UPI0010A8CC45|nr:interferon regulatory factor 4-like [Ornithorhynchus anatinus]